MGGRKQIFALQGPLLGAGGASLQIQLPAAAGCSVGSEQAKGRSRQPGLGPGVLKPDVAFSAVPSPGIWQQHQHLLLHVTAAQEEPGSPSWVPPIQAA